MPWRNWSDDDELLRDIADAVRPEPLEREVLSAGRLVFAYHIGDLEKDLAVLLHDSRLEGAGAVRSPMTGGPRNLTFGVGELRVEIEVSDAGIEGQLIPPEPGRVRLLDASGPVSETTADEVGCFSFPASRTGPVRIECDVAGRRVATEWISA